MSTADLETVTIRELKQRPGAVIDHAVAVGQPIHITRHGQATGVFIQAGPTDSEPREEVPGSVLNAMATGRRLTREQAQKWLDDIEEASLDYEPTDPWGN